MLLVSSTRRRAVHVPIMGALLCCVVLGGLVYLAVGHQRGTGIGALLALVVIAGALRQLRFITVVGGEFIVRSVFGATRLPLGAVSLGVTVRRSSQSGRSFLIYAMGQDKTEHELAEFLKKVDADEYRDVLVERLLQRDTHCADDTNSGELVRQRDAELDTEERELSQMWNEFRDSGQLTRVVIGAAALAALCAALFAWRWV